MLELNQNLGIAGEFQVIVRRADGSVRVDTGMQKNLILDNGLKFYLSQKMTNDNAEEEEEHYGTMFSGLVVGSGNKEPTNTDVKLQSFIDHTSTQRDTEWGKTEPTKDQHPNFVKVWKRTKFIFDNIRNQNISELGLVTRYWDKYNNQLSEQEKRYLLTTRALIKGNDGRPLTITVLEGEVLEVVYQINMYVDIRRQTGGFKLTTYPAGQNPETGVGTESQFEYFLQPHIISQGQHIDDRLYLHDSYYNSVNSHGVKETDDKLTADYDLTQAGYQFDHKNGDWTEFHKLHSGKKTTGDSGSGDKYSGSHQTVELVSTDVLTGKQTVKYKTGIYSHVHDNGIRGLEYHLDHSPYTSLVTGIVIFKNKANGQGIKKTNRQIWEFLASWTIKRWEG